MSWKKVGIIFFSSFLIFATAPLAPAAQANQQENKGRSRTGTTQEGTASKQDTTKRDTTSNKEDIKKVQQALKDKGMYMGPVDGNMNAQTEKALRDFQQKNNLQVTGTVNHETMMALGISSEQHGKAAAGENKPSTDKSAQATAKRRGTTESKEGTTKEGTTKKEKHGAKTSSKDDVRKAQMALKDQGFDPGPVDGIMGPLTMTAIRNFQSHHQLPVTGKLDQQTEIALGIQGRSYEGQTSGVYGRSGETQSQSSDVYQNRSSAGAQGTQRQTQPNRQGTTDTNVDRSSDVYKSHDQSQYGTQSTQQGVGGTTSHDQSQYGTQSTQQGVGGTSSRDQSQYGTQSTQSQFGGTASSHEIRQIQQTLKDMEYNPGEVNGMMTQETQQAIREFQLLNHLPVTGMPDENTKIALGISSSQTQQAFGNDQTLSNQPEGAREKPGYSSEAEQQRQAEYSGVTNQNMVMVAVPADQLEQVRMALKEKGFDPGYGGASSNQMMDAIRKFQTSNNLPATGQLDERTLAALNLRLEIRPEGTGPTSYNELNRSQRRTDRQTRTNDTYTQDRTTTSRDRSTTQDRSTDYDRNKSNKDRSSVDTRDSNKDKYRDPGKVDKDAKDRAAKAVEVLEDLTNTPDKKIPNEILERAEAIAVIPHVIKGAFGVGGRYGKGLVSQRMDNGNWSAPTFLHIGGGSFGAQLGVSATDLVLVFTDRDALKLLEKGTDLKLGADASIAAGPVGRSAEAGVNANLESAIYAYSRAKGLFAGVALDGSVLHVDDDMNKKVYGERVSAQQILDGDVAANAAVRPFMDALNRLMPKKRISQR